MSWTRPSLQTIYDRIKADMETRVTSNVPIPRVSMLGVLAIVFAGGIHLTYGFLVWIFKQIFVDTAGEIGLTRWGNILGLPRKSATFTTGSVSFTGTGGHVVLAGTTFINSEGYEYTTADSFTIGTTTSVTATAVEDGVEYNTGDTVFILASPDPDIDSEVNKEGDGFDDGTDIETLENWALRLLQRFQNPPSSGNVADYVRWALEVDGVGKAWCYPAEEWAGAGTVGVGVATATLGAVSGSVLTDVENHVEEEKPIPAHVDYFTVDPVSMTFGIDISPNTPEMQAAIDEQLTALFILEARPGGINLISHIHQSIAAAGPDDYDITEIRYDGLLIPTANFTTPIPQVATFGGATYGDI